MPNARASERAASQHAPANTQQTSIMSTGSGLTMRIVDRRKVNRDATVTGIGDHCDKCHLAKAKMIAAKGEFLLALCGHHGRKYGAVLTADGWTIREIA